MSIINDFKLRVLNTRVTRWVRFAAVSCLFFAWVAWLGNWWVALWWLLLFDLYITGYIPLSWWKKSKSAVVRTVMSWIDAIVYALVLVYFIFAFVGQNYQIPSSSLEKTLLTGDFLWVNKTAYGPRVPMTPLHFPLAQNTLPGLNCKSYFDKPQFDYHRLSGYDTIKVGDIVVFNFPAGDTVALNQQNPDIYMLSRMIGLQLANNDFIPMPTGSAVECDIALRAAGMQYIRANQREFGDVIWRPVDRRENYVKRTVGLPGQEFQIIDGEIYNDGKRMKMPENVQFCYSFRHKKWKTMTSAQRDAFWDDLGVSVEDRTATPPLTAEMVAKLEANPDVTDLKRCEFTPYDTMLFPLATSTEKGWTLDNYGPLVIPAKGMTIELTEDNWATYGHTIAHYEPHTAEWRNGRAYIDGKPADTYTFEMDYYFMMGDNRHKSSDSRFWGFVPEDHIVGHPEMILISFDKDRSFPFNIRWNRIFRKAQKD